MNQGVETVNDYSIFLSYRAHDIEIANAFSRNFRRWGISRENIFQFTDSRSGVAPGESIPETVIDEIRRNDLFISIYTSPTFDWSYCMYERGAADAVRSKPSQVVTVHFSDARLPIRQDQLSIDGRSSDEIYRFVHKFHTDLEWAIPHSETRERLRPFLQFLSATDLEEIKFRADKLFDDLQAASTRTSERSIFHRLEFLQFSLDPINLSEVKRLRKAARECLSNAANDENATDEDRETARKESNSLRAEATIILNEKLAITQDTEPAALRHFGVGRVDQAATFSSLFRRWQQELDQDRFELSAEDKAWKQMLLEDFSRSTEFAPSKPLEYGLRSPELSGDALIKPVIVRCSEEVDGSMTFDCYLVKTSVG
ncbi:MAG: hypothetical protein AAGM21_10165 [Pseudomonadota bacterium]